jgi:hypothetical protein
VISRAAGREATASEHDDAPFAVGASLGSARGATLGTRIRASTQAGELSLELEGPTALFHEICSHLLERPAERLALLGEHIR